MGSTFSYTVNHALQGPAFAYMSIGLVGIFFGSNYVITKKVPTGDGMSFQWFMCLGILFWAFFMMFLGGFSPNCYDTLTFEWGGVLGGFLWGLGNVMVPTIIDCIGLGMGMLVWGITNFLVGWLIGLLGLGSLEPRPEPGSIVLSLNISGGVVGVLSMLMFAFIKPSVTKLVGDGDDAAAGGSIDVVDSDADDSGAEQWPLLRGGKQAASVNRTSSGEPAALDVREFDSLLSREIVGPADSLLSERPVGVDSAGHDDSAPPQRLLGLPKKWVGLFMAVLAGSLYGFYLIPFSIWSTKHAHSRHGPLEYVFSLCLGIFLASSLAYLIYVVYKRNRPQVYAESILPAIVCGMMWAVATVSWMFMNSYFSLAVGYPIGAIVPNLVSSAWSVFYFKEIRGRRNLLFLSAGLVLNIVCVVLVVLSKSSS